VNLDLLAAPKTIVHIAIAFLLLEITALLILHRVTARGLPRREYLLNAISGLLLMLALRCALDALWPLMALCLTSSGVAHLSDIANRLRRRQGSN